MSFKSIFITISVLVTLALIGGGLYIWYQTRGLEGLILELSIPPQVAAGEPFELSVDISNGSSVVLENARLTVELPPETVFLGSDRDRTIEFRDLGAIGAGSVMTETFELLVLGGGDSVRDVTASLTYLPASLGSRFERNKSASFSVIGERVSVDIDTPTKVFAGEAFEATVTYRNTGNEDLDGARLTITSPPPYEFESATPKPTVGNTTWELGSITRGGSGTITIRGKLIGPDNARYDFKTAIESVFLGRSYPIAEQSASVTIEPSPLSLSISLNGSTDYIARTNDNLSYTIDFTNNTDVALRDVVVRARLSGALFDFSTLSGSGFLRASDGVLVWNASNIPLLALLSPGGSGAVEFRIRTLSDYPIRRLSDKHFTLTIDADIESPTVPYSVSADKTVAVASLETKVGGRIALDAKGYFRDAASGILNSGSLPLTVGKPTNFTVHWVIKNYADDVSNVRVKGFLGGNVRFTGVTKNTTGEELVWNERTQEVVWDVGKISAGKGVLTPPAEAIFQVEVLPSLTNIGSAMTLVGDTTLTATDQFTEENASVRDSAVITDRLDDPTVSPSDGTVVQ